MLLILIKHILSQKIKIFRYLVRDKNLIFQSALDCLYYLLYYYNIVKYF